MSKKIIVGILICLFLLGGEATAVHATSASAIFQEVNQFRNNNGLVPFQYNGALASAAQSQANYMAANTVFTSHIGAGGSTPQSRANAAGYIGRITENIVGGTGMTAARGLTWWVSSPVHYNTLITSRYQEAGTGFATNGSENFYVLVVGQPSDAPPPPAADNSPEPLFITPITLAQPGEDGSIVHVVQDGQALWSLAAHYEVTLSDLLLFNSLPPNAIVQPGDRITIRLAEGQAPPPTPTPPTMHTVLEGQSLWSIAVQYSVKLGDILWLNSLPEDTILQPGAQIRVRLGANEAPPPTPTPILYHAVRSGQTLWEIAISYGLSLDELLAFNNIDQNTLLIPGDQLLVRQPLPTVPPTMAPTATALPSTPTPQSPTPTAPQPSAAVSAQISQPAATPVQNTERSGETAVAPATDNNLPTVSSILMGIAIGFLILGLLAVIVFRSELI
jgi:uncharacterized protein YkwD